MEQNGEEGERERDREKKRKLDRIMAFLNIRRQQLDYHALGSQDWRLALNLPHGDKLGTLCLLSQPTILC